MEINVIAELERCGIPFIWSGEDEVRVECPFHKDETPSVTINVRKRVFICRTAGCGEHGDIVKLLAAKLRVTPGVMHVELAKLYGHSDDKVVDVSVVEKAHGDIWNAGPLLGALRDRAITDDDIRKYRLGVSEGRVTIPIKNVFGLYVNVRRYLPGAPGKDKMKNMRGRGSPVRLYPIEQMTYDTVMLCGGEMKAIVAARQLNPHGIGCVCPTAGEGNFDVALLRDFANKRVIVQFDIDKAGRDAARIRCRQLKNIAESIYLLELPLDPARYPKGDTNDFVKAGGDLWPLVELLFAGEQWTDDPAPMNETPVDSTLVDATVAKMTGKRVNFTAIVTTMDNAPFSIPHTGRVKCDRSQKNCSICAVWSAPDGKFELGPEHDAILEMVGSSKTSVNIGLSRAVGMPPGGCPVATFEIDEYFNAEDTMLGPELDMTSRSTERTMQPAVCIGKGLELNEPYRFTGRMWPHPRTQQSTLLLSSYTPTQDALQTYQPDDLDELAVFQPREWTVDALEEKLDAIYADLSANVTRIYQRRDLHLTIDLAYHSPLMIPFDGRVENGWVQVLVVGDTAQGKSEVTCGRDGKGGLMNYYGLGVKVEVKNASVAGLLGGCVQSNGRWYVSWGVIPTHDKRLVVLEELSGAKPDTLSKLTDMRSSGVAEIPKIERRRTHARVRLVALSNPPEEAPMQTFNFGIEAARDLMGSAPDLRRFDMALIVNKSELAASTLNMLQAARPHVVNDHTSALCRSLVLWTWTRTDQQVVFEDDATTAALAEATRLCSKFTDDIPLLDRGSARLKIARLAASLAGRTFSHVHNDPDVLLVRECHVRYITQWLEKVYSSAVSGYLDYTQATLIRDTLQDPMIVQKRIESLPFPRDFVKHVLAAHKLDSSDLQDWCGWDRLLAQDFLSFLVRKHAVSREGRGYRKTPQFIDLLKTLSMNGHLVDRPEYIKEQF